ncbi:MAG: hypothetical protein KKH04_20550 [Proteobacteria bacterium]|nr:hypothetical protein [Pseudomonadota bacterium]
MGYWFENPTLKALAPLALSTSSKGLTTIFNTPKMFIGSRGKEKLNELTAKLKDSEELEIFLTLAGG